MNIYYMGLESYSARYTMQLTEWNRRVFNKAKNVNFIEVEGEKIRSDEEIKVGSVLDAHGRTHYSLTQNANLVRLMHENTLTDEDVIFYEDMFTPGIEALPYIIDQHGLNRPRVFVRCLAQTVDPDDFVHRTGMFNWMRQYELMVDEICFKTGGGILVASEELVYHLRIAGFKAPIYVTGLPFGKEEVLERATPAPWEQRQKKVVFAARWDSEKQPAFYCELARMIRDDFGRKDIEFEILTGHKQLKSDKQEHLDLLKKAPIRVREGLSKNEYYSILANSRVLFNCALQDWVSNTVSEADTLGCMTLYPAYRSFPEVFANNPAHMYIPWSIDDAAEKLIEIVDSEEAPDSIGAASDLQNKTIQTTLDVFLKGWTHPRRRGQTNSDYRSHTAEPKY